MKRLKYLLMRIVVFAVTLPTRVRTKLFKLVGELAPLLQASPLPQSMKFHISRFLLTRMQRHVRSTQQTTHDLGIKITRERWRKAHSSI